MTRSELLRELPWRWVLFWLFAPNLPIMLMWPVGGPPMFALLVLFGALALLVSQLPGVWLRALGAAVLTLWIYVFYLAAMFAIPALNFPMFFQFLLDVRPLRAPEYVIAGLVLFVAFAITVTCAPRVPRFTRLVHVAVAGLAVFAFAGVDAAISAKTRSGYRVLPDTAFSSAVSQAGLTPASADRRHVLLVVVEALGLPTAPDEKRLFEAAWHRPGWESRFDTRHGSTPFYGSTTSGELRELCGLWSDHTRFDFGHSHCLPKRFREAGYEATAIHSFGGSLFGRREWYPKLGFQKIVFGDALLAQGLRQCDGVFPGACDPQVPPLIARQLRAAKAPQFVYWLTLNSHLPIPVDDQTAHGECIVGPPAWKTDYPRVCRLFQTHRQLADAIDAMIMAPDFPPTDVLIVGDHKPPFFDRGSRAHFDQRRVPWIYLRYRGAARRDSAVQPGIMQLVITALTPGALTIVSKV